MDELEKLKTENEALKRKIANYEVSTRLDHLKAQKLNEEIERLNSIIKKKDLHMLYHK